MKRCILLLLCALMLSGCAAAPKSESPAEPSSTETSALPAETPVPMATPARQKPTEYPEGEVTLTWLALYTWVDEFDPGFHLVFDAVGVMEETDLNTGVTLRENIRIDGENLYRVSVTGQKELLGRIYMKQQILYIEREDEIGTVSYIIE